MSADTCDLHSRAIEQEVFDVLSAEERFILREPCAACGRGVFSQYTIYKTIVLLRARLDTALTRLAEVTKDRDRLEADLMARAVGTGRPE